MTADGGVPSIETSMARLILPTFIGALWFVFVSIAIGWQRYYIQSPAFDSAVLLVAALLSLPVLAIGHATPRLLPVIGCVIMGIVLGMLMMDSVFDVLVLTDASINDGWSLVSGRKVAFFYYNSILNSPIVNGVLFSLLMTMALGALVGLERARTTGDVSLKMTWYTLVGLNAVGNSGYIGIVIPRYLALRAATRFDAADFDGWAPVLGARLLLLASTVAAIAICMRLTPVPAGGREKQS